MSVGRKDWSALSSLARQRTLEDEEEQERERRRRHRHLSSTTDDEAPRPTQNGDQRAAERLPSVEETEVPKPPPPGPKDEDEDIQSILRIRQERRQRQKAVEAQAPVQERLGAEEGRDSSSPEQAMQQPLAPKKEPEALPRRRLSREQRGPWAQDEECLVSKEPSGEKKGLPEKTLVLEKSSTPQQTVAPTKRLASEKSCLPEKLLAPERTALSQKMAALEKKGTPEKSAPGKSSILEKSLGPEKAPVSEKTAALERRSTLDKKKDPEKVSISEKLPEKAPSVVSEKASFFEKSSAAETKLGPKKAAASAQPQAAGGSQASRREPEGRAVSRKSPSSSEVERRVAGSPAVASRFPPITIQVKIPSKEEEAADAPSPTQVTYSTSLKRSSPRTISFRMSPRKDNSETTLTRSASVRLPASTVKLGEKLERYHTAVQRSESVRSQGSSRTEFFVAPTGVASKRHLFEKELAGQSRADPASSRKDNLRLSGVVTSRINLWITRTQESGDQDPQEVQKETAAAKRTQWAKKSDGSLDAEV
ncbi:ladinin-1 isoform X2 [Heterocephalus glaber]|uniref:Ladinin-1 n=1 Tax=Heterocephalus glaber TaxID=10181 RepID=A0A0P6K494_HETGA|nr:ladinin-1 isoform X2 [Heterocephalus glaber]